MSEGTLPPPPALPHIPPAAPTAAPATSAPTYTDSDLAGPAAPAAFAPNTSPDRAIALSLSGLWKSFGGRVAVNNLSLSIPTGAFYGIVGPNGAGKTTSLNMATGLLQPDAGTAYVRGIDIWADPAAAKQHLGVLPDGMHFFDRLSGHEHVVYAGLLRGMDKSTANARAQEMLTAFDLAPDAFKQVGDYSSGMRKKIGLASALVHAPQVLVLDEPFEAVDPVSAANLQAILGSFVAGGGTVVLSSHVMALVEKLCSHVAVINHGQILISGTTAQVGGGVSLEDRFTELVGGVRSGEGLEWLRHSSD